jgi:N-terminal domain of reverse transcriptase
VRIAKAIKLGRHGKAKAIQWILTHSYYAKLLAVKRPRIPRILSTQTKAKNEFWRNKKKAIAGSS